MGEQARLPANNVRSPVIRSGRVAWLSSSVALAVATTAAIAQPTPIPTFTIELQANVPLTRLVMVADSSRFDEKYERVRAAAGEAQPMSFHRFVERERSAQRVESQRFNASRRARVSNVNRTVTYRVYYLCPQGEWRLEAFDLLNPPDDAEGLTRVPLDARCE